LEANGNVVSEWETDNSGPARRVYKLTRQGEQHLQEWAAVLDHVAKSMSRFVKTTRSMASEAPAAKVRVKASR
jgi:DNA-binding PadR family transcriptional regulator